MAPNGDVGKLMKGIIHNMYILGLFSINIVFVRME